jgi:ATP-dependent DNA ligase I
MLLGDLVATSAAVTETSGRLQKIERLADLLSRVPDEEIETAVAFLSGGVRQGRVGVGYRAIAAASDVPPHAESVLTLQELDGAFAALAELGGKGSAGERTQALRRVFSRATAAEQDFLRRLLYGELRQGALEGVLVEAVARAARVSASHVRRAAMLAGDLGPVARAALTAGDSALDAFVVQLARPIQPMLAESGESVDAALDQLGDASLEYKLDGARIQVHKANDEVRIFSRTLRDVSEAAPEVVEMVRALPARELILDGEVLALRADGRPHPFQITMRRFGRTRDVARSRAELPLTPFFFDCLYADGAILLDEPHERRVATLQDLAGGVAVPRIVRPTRETARAFAAEAIDRGHEGVMAKALAAPYAAGRRGAAWLKVKQPRTLDLVVLAAEWGHGRRRGWLSNLHLGARDPEHHAFVMLGKTFKGMTDEMLTWQTQHLLGLEIGRDAYTVHVRPELVVEVAFNEIQESPVYPGGLALRFARVKRYRTDKTAADADSIEAVRALANW